MQLGFVNLLEIDEILHLWDRLLGYMDTTLLPITATAIFLHRADMLFHVSFCSNDVFLDVFVNITLLS